MSAPAGAVQTPAAFAGRPVTEVADGAPLVLARELVWYRVPSTQRAAWARLLARMGPRTWGAWDRDTGVVRRIWGEGAPAIGSVASPIAAERVAREILGAHLDLLAPGATPADFVLVANEQRGGARTIGFVQERGGLAVEGGQISFRFKNDRLFMIASEALPEVPRPSVRAQSDDEAAAAALAWIRDELAPAATLIGVGAPRILPLIRAGVGGIDYRTVIPVEVDAAAPRGRWQVYIDAVSGRPVARTQTLRFAAGTVAYNAPVRQPKLGRKDFPANQATLTVNGVNQASGADGSISWANNNPAAVSARASGTQIVVQSQAGGDATKDLMIGAGQTGVWSAASDEYVDAQLATFVHTNVVMDYVRAIDPGLGFVNQQFSAKVNINDACNAFYDGQSINFFRAAGGCGNTGRIADIVYHEFGHGVHDHAVIQGVGFFEGALSEGVSDYLAATITDDSEMGGGFFDNSNGPLRSLDPAKDSRWPDDINGDPHVTGQIIGEALWDLRKALIAEQGPGAVSHADKLYYEAIRRAVDIPSMYFEVIAADDNDGDLDNGTPNLCLINEAFARHGLYKVEADVSAPSVASPLLSGYEVTAALAGGGGGCKGSAIDKAELVWRLREAPATGGVIAMDVADAMISGTIPQQVSGTVVQYQVSLSFTDGSTMLYPENRADPFFEFYVGAVEPIYCTDFEGDPALDGWTHGLSKGMPGEGADDWTWGEPMAPASSGDPLAAFDGARVFGNDLGGGNYNGTYQSDKTNFARTPTIDTSGYAQVRLQYRRWLNVEDGYFDRATIYANDQVAWQNRKSPNEADASVHHTDNVWRFHDVDLTKFVANDAVSLTYELSSDQGLELGGWTIDAFCVVGLVDGPDAACGDGIVSPGEACDDGPDNSDAAADACRTNCQLPACGDGVVDSGEACDDGNTADNDACPANCLDGETTGATGGTGGTGSTGGTGGSDGTSAGGTTDDGSATATESGGIDDGEGCGCRQEPGGGGALAALGLLGLVGLRRRRRG